jgi:hypothetical protein
MKNVLVQAGVTIPLQEAGVDAGEAGRLGRGQSVKKPAREGPSGHRFLA